MITREADSTKQESSTSDNAQNFNASTTTTSSWSRLKDPRIIRVSRAFGGKDRHSKVCTVRGLRDRRVRLSVPTAIQLYDLQDRLGLNQPSKVVDWLLNAAKHEIDELPPLQFPQGSFNAANLLPMMNLSHQIRSPDHQSDKQGLGGKSKAGDGNWARSREEGSVSNLGLMNQDAYVSAENLSSSSRQNPSLMSSLMNTSSVSPINSFVRGDPSNLTLSQPPTSVSHGSDLHNFSLVYQPYGMSAHPYFHSQISASNAELFDSKNPPSLATSSLTPPSLRPIHFNMTANLLPSQNNDAT